MHNFDQFIGIDWSGAKAPIFNKAISVSVIDKGATPPHLVDGPWSRQKVADWIVNLSQTQKRILIGVDCNFGYAASTTQKQVGAHASHNDLWQEVENVCESTPNFFAQEFWSNPTYASDFWVSGKMREGFTMPKRQTEVLCAEAGFGRPESPFKLIGAKQVGKGGLAGMRMAHYLKQALGDKIAFWPFEMDLVDAANIVVTEIYPRQFLMRSGHGLTKIRTLDDLNLTLRFLGAKLYVPYTPLSDHDTDSLASAAGLRYLCGDKRNIPKDVSHPPIMSYNAQHLEGWIFGITG